jgi:hypothetical protein
VDIEIARSALMMFDEHLTGTGWFELEVVDDQPLPGRRVQRRA